MVSLNFYDSDKRPWPNPRLQIGSIIGHTTPTSVKLWLCVDSPGKYWLIISKQPIPPTATAAIVGEDKNRFFMFKNEPNTEFSNLKIQDIDFTNSSNLIKVIDIEGLEANNRYYYALFEEKAEKNCWRLGQKDPVCFQTFPKNTPEITFGIYSCHQPYDQGELLGLEMWDRFYEELCNSQANFVLAMGDQVYVDANKQLNIWHWLRQVKKYNPSPSDMLSWYRNIYRIYWGLPQVLRVFQNFPTYMIWDDHEIMDGWGSFTPKELAEQLYISWKLENPEENLHFVRQMFEAAKQVYQEYQHSHNPPTDETINQFDYGFNCGDCGFYVLDMRGDHDFNRPQQKLLGNAQWGRFETWLQAQYNSNIQVLFIVVPVPLVHLKGFVVNIGDIPYSQYTDDFRDHWEHKSNWEERNQLFAKVFEFSQTTNKPVIFLSGDVHLGAAFKISHPNFPSAQVFQLTSSGICYASLTEFNRFVLEKMIQIKGNLADRPGNIPYKIKNLGRCRYHNFGIVRLKKSATGNLSISYDLFSSSNPRDSIEKQTIELGNGALGIGHGA